MSSSPNGEVRLQNGSLVVDFRFSPERVEAIKRLGRARFNKEAKHWVLPLESYNDLAKSEHFNPELMHYAFSEGDLQHTTAASSEEREAARLRYLANPFKVNKLDIDVLELDVRFFLDSRCHSLLALPKFSSRARRLLERLPGCHYLKNAGGYFFPVEELNSFLKVLRSSKLSFAVEEQAGEHLANTASQRAELLAESKTASASDLVESLLIPFLDVYDEYGEVYFCLASWTTKQLRDLLPDSDNFVNRKLQAAKLSADNALALLHRADKVGHRVYLTSAARSELESRRENYELKMLAVKQEEIERREALLARKTYFQNLGDAKIDESLVRNPEIISRLYPHQRVAVNWLQETPQAFLGDDMGLGKTLTVLCYYELLLVSKVCDLMLVTCPNSLVKNWLREGKTWFPHLKLCELPDKRDEKQLFFKRLRWGGYTTDAIVVNYEAVRLDYLRESFEHLLNERRVLLVLDESQRVKNHLSKTFNALLSMAPLAERKVLMSGTPTPKDLSDIWAQMRILDAGERFGTNYYDWLGNIAELGNKYSEYAVKKYKPDALRATIKRVHEILLRRRKEDVLNLPEKTFSRRELEMTGEQLKRFEEVRKDLLLRVSNLSGKSFVREINNVLEEYLRAVQIASNPRLVDSSFEGDPVKYKELDILVDEIVREREEKLVVWTNYLGNIRELTARYQQLGAQAYSGEISTIERDAAVNEFQNGSDIRILIAVPAAGGVGITLTAAQTAIYLDKTWNAEHYQQSVDRLHRISQTGTVNIISLIASKVDELIERCLLRKARAQARLLGDRIHPSPLQLESDSNPSRQELIEAVNK